MNDCRRGSDHPTVWPTSASAASKELAAGATESTVPAARNFNEAIHHALAGDALMLRDDLAIAWRLCNHNGELSLLEIS